MGNNIYRVGCDIGGTFTDFVAIERNTGNVSLGKVLTTPSNPATGIFNGFDELQERHAGLLGKSELIVHGTTLVINAIIERKGSNTALITTRGFRDILEMRNELRYDVYDLQIEMPEPLIPRERRFELTQRTTYDGRNHVEIDYQELDEIIEALKAQEIETVAVCLLHSYANDDHERQVGDALKKAIPGIDVSLSCEVLPEIKEYNRTSTTAVNAYVKPLVRKYLNKIEDEVVDRSFPGDFLIMQSSSGVSTAENAKDYPVRIIESGPAGGVALSQWWGEKLGIKDLLSFDMGGTTAKLCAILDGSIAITKDYETAQAYQFKHGSGISVNVPVVDLLEIGAGGGSIAQINRLGLLQVGPQSAGASPGPVCYGLGGDQPTVTDADLILGYLNPGFFLGSNMALDLSAAEETIFKTLAEPLDLSLVEAAFGIHNVVNENMAAAARLHLAQMSIDASTVSMMASGGAGPVHAYGVAKKLGCRKLLVPRFAGVVSAFGMLVADIAMDTSRSLKAPLSKVSMASLEDEFTNMVSVLSKRLPATTGDFKVRVQRSADMKYVGQGSAIHIDLSDQGADTGITLEAIRQRYETAYAEIYGRIDSDVEIEIETIKVVVSLVPEKTFQLPLLPDDGATVEMAAKAPRKVYVPDAKDIVLCDVYDRYALRPGHRIKGPAIIEERETSIVVNDPVDIHVDELGTVVVDVKGGGNG